MGVPAAVVVGDGHGTNEPSVSSPGERRRSDGVGTEVGLFEELTPSGFKASTTLPESRETCPFQNAVGGRDTRASPEDNRADARSLLAATEGADAPVQGSLEQSLPDENAVLSAKSASHLSRGASPGRWGSTDGRVPSEYCTSVDGNNCASATIASDIRVHTAGGEDQGGNVAETATGRRRSGPGGGTSDRAISSSAYELSSPQVIEIALARSRIFAVNSAVRGATVAPGLCRLTA